MKGISLFLLLLILLPGLVSASANVVSMTAAVSASDSAAHQRVEQQAFIAAGQTTRADPPLTIQNVTIPSTISGDPRVGIVLDRFVWADAEGIKVKIAFWYPSQSKVIVRCVNPYDYYSGRFDPGSIIWYECGFLNDLFEDTELNVGDG